MDNITAAKQKEAPPISVRYFAKMKGKGRSPLQVNIKDSLKGLLGGFLTILTLTYLTSITSTELLMAPFGASCVLAFGVWNAPLSQPRNIIGGHLISAFIGLAMYSLLGSNIVSISLGVGLTIFFMAFLGVIHPPAGANPIIIILGGYGWSYLLMPVLLGAVIIVLFGLVINNLRQTRKYPQYW